MVIEKKDGLIFPSENVMESVRTQSQRPNQSIEFATLSCELF